MMRPSKPTSQPRQPHRPRASRASPATRDRVSFSPLPPASQPGVRFVDVRVPVPATNTSRSSPVGQHYPPPSAPSPSPIKVATSGSSVMSPLVNRDRRSSSPYGFIPIPKDGVNDRGGLGGGGGGGPMRFASPPTVSSPYDFCRKATPSPSMMSTMTSDTLETASMTLDTSLARNSFSGSPGFRLVSPSPLSGSAQCFRPATPQCRPVTPQSRASPRPKTPTNGRKSPFPKNDDDTTRKTRIKTELCMHYENGRPCPFGADCTYAHGEEELQMTKLLDLEKAGLIDIETYRTKPCLAFVMTGSCPFGKRCTGIHDPRVTGSSRSWLPHTETQGNTINTDINVEALHQKRSNEVQYCTPFGHKFSLLDSSDDWCDLYKLICNINYNANNRSGGQWVGGRRFHQPQPNLDAVAKMVIALELRGGPDWQYKFRPQHIIHGELCMVLQHRAFCLTHDAEQTDAIEIPIHACQPHMNENHVIVHELAFGPDSDTSVRGVSLFFNIPNSAIQEFTQSQAKRFRWKRGVNKKDDDKNEANKVVSVLGTLDNFEMIRPHDADAFDLATNIMRHRLHVIQAEKISNMRERFESLKSFESEKKALQKRFEDLKRHWIAWAWPVNVGRKKVDKKTPVPKVDGNYEFESANEAEEEGIEPGSAASSIWRTFVSESFDDDTDMQEDSPLQAPPPATSKTNASGLRLSVFRSLALGHEIAKDRTLPDFRVFHRERDPQHSDDDSERCWKALLLRPEDNVDPNEWDLVREHFDKSRSKKVLSIIQAGDVDRQ